MFNTCIFIIIIVIASSAVAFGCGCRCGCRIPCIPRPCPPIPPPCPPPVVCPQVVCPSPPPCPPPVECPPVVCPPPSPCPPPLPPPPPLPCIPSLIPLPTPCLRIPSLIITNECCNTCTSQCQYRTQRRRRSLPEIFGISVNETINANAIDAKCNNAILKNAMLQNILIDVTESRRAIQQAAEKALSAQINVICAKGELSYFVYTGTFCQTTKNNITCYAFKPL